MTNRDDAELVDVSFRWPAGPDVVVDVHLTGHVGESVHHPNRLRHDGVGHVATLSLPVDACVSYGFRVSAGVEHADVPAWELVDHLRADPANPDRISGAFGSRGSTSVLELPGARRHHAWPDAHQRSAPLPSSARPVWRAVGGRRCAWLPGDPALPALVLLDGDLWAREDFGFLHAWAARAAQGAENPTVVFVDTSDREVLADRVAMGDLVDGLLDEIPGGASAGLVVAGQSYGGLAAAGLLLDRPEAVRGGVLQSGSFWFGADDEDGDGLDVSSHGDVLRELGAHRSEDGERRVVVQAGSSEGAMLHLSRAFAALARRAGLDASFEEFSGGHDYAWYRHGLLYAVDQLWPWRPR